MSSAVSARSADPQAAWAALLKEYKGDEKTAQNADPKTAVTLLGQNFSAHAVAQALVDHAPSRERRAACEAFLASLPRPVAELQRPEQRPLESSSGSQPLKVAPKDLEVGNALAVDQAPQPAQAHGLHQVLAMLDGNPPHANGFSGTLTLSIPLAAGAKPKPDVEIGRSATLRLDVQVRNGMVDLRPGQESIRGTITTPREKGSVLKVKVAKIPVSVKEVTLKLGRNGELVASATTNTINKDKSLGRLLHDQALPEQIPVSRFYEELLAQQAAEAAQPKKKSKEDASAPGPAQIISTAEGHNTISLQFRGEVRDANPDAFLANGQLAAKQASATPAVDDAVSRTKSALETLKRGLMDEVQGAKKIADDKGKGTSVDLSLNLLGRDESLSITKGSNVITLNARDNVPARLRVQLAVNDNGVIDHQRSRLTIEPPLQITSKGVNAVELRELHLVPGPQFNDNGVMRDTLRFAVDARTYTGLNWLVNLLVDVNGRVNTQLGRELRGGVLFAEAARNGAPPAQADQPAPVQADPRNRASAQGVVNAKVDSGATGATVGALGVQVRRDPNQAPSVDAREVQVGAHAGQTGVTLTAKKVHATPDSASGDVAFELNRRDKATDLHIDARATKVEANTRESSINLSDGVVQATVLTDDAALTLRAGAKTLTSREPPVVQQGFDVPNQAIRHTVVRDATATVGVNSGMSAGWAEATVTGQADGKKGKATAVLKGAGHHADLRVDVRDTTVEVTSTGSGDNDRFHLGARLGQLTLSKGLSISGGELLIDAAVDRGHNRLQAMVLLDLSVAPPGQAATGVAPSALAVLKVSAKEAPVADAAGAIQQIATMGSWDNTGGDIAPFVMASTLNRRIVVASGVDGNQVIEITRNLAGEPLSVAQPPIRLVNVGAHYYADTDAGLVEVPADGDCFYHAVGHVLGRTAADLRGVASQHAEGVQAHTQELIDHLDDRIIASAQLVQGQAPERAIAALYRDLATATKAKNDKAVTWFKERLVQAGRDPEKPPVKA